MARQKRHAILCHQGQHQADCISVGHTHQVDKARITHETRIRMEQPEPWNTQQNEAEQRIDNPESILIQQGYIIENPIG